MRIVDYETFIRMPAGTIFAPWTSSVFLDRFQIKVDGGREYEGRYIFNGTMPLEPDTECLYEGCEDEEAAFSVYDGDSTDASHYKWFCILQPYDVSKLVSALHWALEGCPGEYEKYDDEYSNSYASCCRLNNDKIFVSNDVYDRIRANPTGVTIDSICRPMLRMSIDGIARDDVEVINDPNND